MRLDDAAALFELTELRPGQREAVSSVVAGRDTLVVMPTGYGKSAIYQLAGAVREQLTVVVSPLLSLQADQVAAIAAHPWAPEAAAINSTHSASANDVLWLAAERGQIRYLFLSPEQLALPGTVERLRAIGVGLFVVDEAHCVSAWGHDLRPDYLWLGSVIERLDHPTVLALTATGPPPVRDEIAARLGMRDPLVLTRGFDRPNLRLAVTRHETETAKWDAVLRQATTSESPGLVYVATRADTTRYAELLRERGVRAEAYHGGLSAQARRRAHERFRDDETDVVVATSAFGMGIDKPNVRFVVHEAIPESLDSYYQEAGRAGRDGEPATVTLHYRDADLGLRTFFASGMPAFDELVDVYFTLLEGGPHRLSDLAEATGLRPRSISRLLGALQSAQLVASDRHGFTVTDRTTPLDAAERAQSAAESRERIEQSRIAMMRAYAETRQCRRQFLLGYFGEHLDEPCENCDSCDAGVVTEMAAPSQARVRHVEWGEGMVMSEEGDRLTVFFETEGYKVIARTALQQGILQVA